LRVSIHNALYCIGALAVRTPLACFGPGARQKRAYRCTTLPFSKYTNGLNSDSLVTFTDLKFQTVAQTLVCDLQATTD